MTEMMVGEKEMGGMVEDTEEEEVEVVIEAVETMVEEEVGEIEEEVVVETAA